MDATWTNIETGARLAVRVLGDATGRDGSAMLRVCKAGANPLCTFLVRPADVVLA